MTAADPTRSPSLQPHPEGGRYPQTSRHPPPPGPRAAVTAIYFLLERGQRSRWHRVDATELWLWHAGAPLTLEIAAEGGAGEAVVLGPNLAAGERPQAVVPKHAWQAAESRGEWTLISCVVAPGFEFAGFEMAAEGWEPG